MKFLLYFIGFFIPFVYQILYARESAEIYLLNSICFLTQLYFCILAVYQYKPAKECGLLTKWNVADISQFVLFLGYFVARVSTKNTEVIPDLTAADTSKVDVSMQVFWVVFNSIFLVVSVLKLTYFMRVNKDFDQLLNLCSLVLG